MSGATGAPSPTRASWGCSVFCLPGARLQCVGFGGIFPARQGCHRSLICESVVCGSCALGRAGTQVMDALCCPAHLWHSRLGGSSSAPRKNSGDFFFLSCCQASFCRFCFPMKPLCGDHRVSRSAGTPKDVLRSCLAAAPSTQPPPSDIWSPRACTNTLSALSPGSTRQCWPA